MKGNNMKQVELWVSGSGNGYFEGVLVYGQRTKPFRGEFVGTADQNLLSGVLSGLEMLKESCVVRVVTSTPTGIDRRQKGRNTDQKEACFNAARKAGHELLLDYRHGCGEEIKAFIRSSQGARQKTGRSQSKQKHNDADWAETHYRWNGEWIPNDVDMTGGRVRNARSRLSEA